MRKLTENILQAILHLVYYLKSELGPHVGDIMDVSINGLKSNSVAVRCNVFEDSLRHLLIEFAF
jgi:hypothetical protein